MDFLNAFILPLLVLAAGGILCWFAKWGMELYNKTQKRITHLELRLHKRELVGRLGGLIEDRPRVKEFFAAYDYLYQHNKNKSAEHFIEKIDVIIAEAQRTAKEFDNSRTECIIAAAEQRGYKCKFNEIEIYNDKVFEWQNAIPDKIEITIADSEEKKQ